MMDSQYGLPVLIRNGNDPVELQRVSLGRSGETNGYNESWLQELVFKNPTCLPVAEIDQAFSELIPVCRELNTPVGPIDVLYVTPKGRLVILEAKLWRNPEVRRKVVGQILDYAKEVSRWTYDDLQREVARVTGRKGNALFELVRESYPDVDEASFVDEVARGLRLGRFLLLIVGDGIREGVGAIAEFLERNGSLDFTFGLVEMGIYQIDGQDLLVQPRVLSKTMVFRRSVVVLEQRGLEVQEEGEEQEQSEEQHERSQFFHEFWSHFLGHLQLDDTLQPMANVTKSANVYFPMPPSGSQAWVSAYLAPSGKGIGVYLRLARGEFGDSAFEDLQAEQEAINEELGLPEVEWRSRNGKHSISTRMAGVDPLDPAQQEDIRQWIADHVNRFVNVFRPRLARLVATA